MSNHLMDVSSRNKIKGIFLFFLFSFLVCQPVFAQKKKKEEKKRKFHSIEIRTLNDTLIPTLVNKVASYTFTIDRDSFLLSRNYDLSPIEENLPDMEDQIKNFRSIFERVGQNMNLQGLNTSTIILTDMASKLSSYKTTLQDYKSSLEASNQKVKKILADSALTEHVADSALTDELSDLITEAHSLDTTQKLLLAKINLVYSRVSVNQFEAKDIISDMLYLTISKKINLFTPERSPLFQSKKSEFSRTTEEASLQGMKVAGKAILIYLAGRINLLALALLIIVLIYTWCRFNLRRVQQRPEANKLMNQVLLLKHSLVFGCLLGLFTYTPLFFDDPPSAFFRTFELLRLLAFSVLIFPFLTSPFKKVWILFTILWIFYAWDNLLLHASFGERWMLFIAGILLVLLCIYAMFKSRKIFVQIGYSPVTKAVLIFTLIIALFSVAFNLTGNFYLSKITGLTAIQGLMMGITLKIFCTMVVEVIYLQSEAYHESRFSQFLNFEKLKFRLVRTLWILACILWVVEVTRDLTLYRWFSSYVVRFLEIKRPIGKFHFTFASVLIFLLIIWLSSVISRIINYFFGYEKSVATGKRSGINSMVLILRLCIWATGFLIAVAAAGIPLDKISIMLGALGVGIGFGLQTIVNNLVSGVILAFERPVQIGDQIEVGDKSGIVKEIGVRASKISNSEGADIIIPNGDMLSQQVTNWTMQNRNKRVAFTMGVPYNTNLEKIRTLILDCLKAHDDILHDPEPSLIVTDFGQFAVDLKTNFWVPDLSNSDTIRTNIMMEIKEVLSKEGIQLQSRFMNPYDLQEKDKK